jgi:hypothetical protein
MSFDLIGCKPPKLGRDPLPPTIVGSAEILFNIGGKDPAPPSILGSGDLLISLVN